MKLTFVTNLTTVYVKVVGNSSTFLEMYRCRCNLLYGVNKDLCLNMHIIPISARLVIFTFYTSVYERNYLDASCICILAPNFDIFVIKTLSVD